MFATSIYEDHTRINISNIIDSGYGLLILVIWIMSISYFVSMIFYTFVNLFE